MQRFRVQRPRGGGEALAAPRAAEQGPSGGAGTSQQVSGVLSESVGDSRKALQKKAPVPCPPTQLPWFCTTRGERRCRARLRWGRCAGAGYPAWMAVGSSQHLGRFVVLPPSLRGGLSRGCVWAG